jgi:hypothetical protein
MFEMKAAPKAALTVAEIITSDMLADTRETRIISDTEHRDNAVRTDWCKDLPTARIDRNVIMGPTIDIPSTIKAPNIRDSTLKVYRDPSATKNTDEKKTSRGFIDSRTSTSAGY